MAAITMLGVVCFLTFDIYIALWESSVVTYGIVLCRCTAVTGLLVGNKLFIANVGDSRAVLSRGGKGMQ